MASLCKNLRLARVGASRLLSASTFSSYRPLLNPLRPQSAMRAFHNIAPPSPPPADMPGDIMGMRKVSPAHYLVKIDSFSMFDKLGIDKFETKEFQAGGYKWKLIIYPNGDLYEEYGEVVSVKLALADTSALPANWEVNAVFSICLFNYYSRIYNYALGRIRFDTMTTEWCFHKFISKKYLTDPSSGYLDDDKCIFGAEVFVEENKAAVTEYVSLKNVKVPYKHEIKIPNFASVKHGWDSHKTWTSEEFTAGGHTWKISLYRNGYGEANGCIVSSFLQHVASDNSCERVKASSTVSLISQVSDEHDVTKPSSRCSFIDLDSLDDPKKGYIVNDCVHLEVELYVEAMEEDSI